MLVTGTLVYISARDALLQTRTAQVASIATLKVQRIEQFVNEQRGNILATREYQAVIQGLPAMTRFMNDPQNPQYLQARKALDKRLAPLQEEYDYDDILLVSPEGKIVYASNPDHFSRHLGNPLPDPGNRAFQEGKKGIYFSDIFINPFEPGHFSMMVSAPVSDDQGKFIGVLVFDLNMDNIYLMIQDATGLGRTGETLIAKNTGDGALYLNPLRHEQGSALKKQIKFGDKRALPIQKAVKKLSGAGVAIDYRGKEVISAWRYVPSLDWGLVAKIDRSEALEPIVHEMKLAVLFGVLILLLGAITSFGVSQSFTKSLRALQSGAELIGSGNLDHQVGTRAGDEIGQLSRAFDRMTADLSASRRELESEIAERRKAEDAVRQSEKQYRFLIENLKDLVFTIDLKGGLTFVSRSSEEILGFRNEDGVGRNVIEFVPAEDRARVIATISKGMEGEKVTQFQTPVIKKSGERMFLEVSVSRIIEAGTVVGALCIGRDITERKRMEEELRKHRDHLEELVNERTAELEIAVERLREENEERKRAQEAVQEKEERYRKTLDNMMEGCQIIGFDGRYLYVNDAAARHGRKSREELLGKTMMEAYPGIEPSPLFAAMKRCLDERATSRFENEFSYPDGAKGWFELSISPAPEGIFILSMDITERKAAEQRIAHLNRVLHAIRNVNQLITKETDRDRLAQGICDNLIQGHGYFNSWIALLDQTGKIVHYAQVSSDPKFAALHQQLKQEILPECGQKALKHSGLLVIEDVKACSPCPLVDKGPTRGAFLYRLEYGRKIYGVLSAAIPIELVADAEEQSLFQEVALDISYALSALETEEAHRRAEMLLSESEQKFARVFQESPIAIAVVQDSGSLVEVNDAFIRLTGISRADAIGRTAFELGFIGTEDRPRIYDSFQRQDSVSNLDLTIPVKSGEKRNVLLSMAPLKIGDKPHHLTMFNDITELKRAEDELRKTLQNLKRSNQELEQFAYVASHDLQEPLRMVASYTQLLGQRYEGKLDEKAKKYIDYAVDGAVRMQQLINDLLIYSRVTTRSMQFEPTDSRAALGEALRNLSAALEEGRVLVTNDDLPVVRADATQLMQVFQNLISNALKFRGKDSPHVHLSARDQGNEWLFSVKDNGIGIEAKHADKVFVIFQRLHSHEDYPGTGIGLTVCKRIVERHGGKIWFESEPGKGSIFYFTLPKGKEAV